MTQISITYFTLITILLSTSLSVFTYKSFAKAKNLECVQWFDHHETTLKVFAKISLGFLIIKLFTFPFFVFISVALSALMLSKITMYLAGEKTQPIATIGVFSGCLISPFMLIVQF